MKKRPVLNVKLITDPEVARAEEKENLPSRRRARLNRDPSAKKKADGTLEAFLDLDHPTVRGSLCLRSLATCDSREGPVGGDP